MIDTLRVRVQIPYNIWHTIEHKKSFGIQSPGLEKLRDYLFIPPYNAIVTVSTYDFKYVYLEASLPKIAYGHNVKLLYPYEIPKILIRIRNEFIKKYGDISKWQKWEVMRFDACYAWKFKSNKEAVDVLRFLHTLKYPSKELHWYEDETVTFGGRSFSVTFYMKNPEFQRQYNKLNKDKYFNVAEEGQELSKGVLRYEIRMFKQKLKQLFGKEKIYCEDLFNVDIYYNILNTCFTVLLKNSNRISLSDAKAFEVFYDHFKSKALRIFCFWKVYYSKELHIKSLLKDYSNATTFTRILKDIDYTGVGIPASSIDLPLELLIPSDHAVTPEPKAPNAPASVPISFNQEMIKFSFEKEWRG